MKTLKIYNGLLILVVLFLLFVQATSINQTEEPQIIRAKSFEFVDENGMVRASLHADVNGETIFRLRNSKGEIRVKLGADEDGSGLLLLNGKTEPGIHMLSKNNPTEITVTDGSGVKKVIKP